MKSAQEQYEDKEGWITYKGNVKELNLDPDTLVFCKFRSGCEYVSAKPAWSFFWHHDQSGSDIVAYKIYKEENNRELTEKQKQLAKFIAENCGWKSNMLFVEVYGYVGNEINAIKFDLSKPKGNGTFLSKEQYLDWYYLNEKENQLEHTTNNNINTTEQSNNSIEQIIKEYFEIKETVETKQKELDVLKESLDTKYNELVEKGKSLNVSISIIDNSETTKTEELVITDWRDLKVRDIIWWSGDREHKAGEYEVEELENKNRYTGQFAIYIGDSIWVDSEREQWRFVSRPS